MIAGLNGNTHGHEVHDLVGALENLGVIYLGEGQWSLPKGAIIDGGAGDDWTLTLADGSVYDVWSEE